MAVTVLGKRSRSTTEPDAAGSSIASRLKRRAHIPIYHDNSDDDDNPFVIRSSKHDRSEVSTPKRRGRAPKAKEDDNAVSVKIDAQLKIAKTASYAGAKSVQDSTPRTPRHRDAAVSKHVTVTPRHRLTVTGNPLGVDSPRTPRTPNTPSTTHTIYTAARELFIRSSVSGSLVGRDTERRKIDDFVRQASSGPSCGCLYVSGPPGTGKSAMVEEVCKSWRESGAVKMVTINCMSIKSSRDLSSYLIEELCDDVTEGMNAAPTVMLRRLFASRKKSASRFLVVLDEIDHLKDTDMQLLYSLFEWSLQRPSKLILIGIANALDLTDRFLPRLKAKNLKPELLPFLPYSATQIASIITTRLRSLIPANTTTPDNYVPIVHPAAIQLCSKKVASQTGDLRKAFDIVRHAIEIIEREVKQKYRNPDTPSKTPLIENLNLSSPIAPPKPFTKPASAISSLKRSTSNHFLSELTAENAPRASISHVASISAAAFGNGTQQRLKTLNLQQKAALCTLVSLEKRKLDALRDGSVLFTPSKSVNAAPTVRDLFSLYQSLCEAGKGLQALTSSEFRDVMSSLETLSLVSEVNGRSGSFQVRLTPSRRGRNLFAGSVDEKRLASCVGEKELEDALEGIAGELLKGLLRAHVDFVF